MKVEFYKHNISQQDIDNAVGVLNTPFLTTGEVVSEFEGKFSRYLGCRYTVAALQLYIFPCWLMELVQATKSLLLR